MIYEHINWYNFLYRMLSNKTKKKNSNALIDVAWIYLAWIKLESYWKLKVLAYDFSAYIIVSREH